MQETKSYTGKDFYKSYIDYVGDNPLYQVEYRVFRDCLLYTSPSPRDA